MRQPTALFPLALALGATILVPGPGARAAPIAITACQTISQPGSYVLANNLTGSGDCLVITTSFVTINLAGFSIKAGAGVITAVAGLQGIGVRNGSISAGEGVLLAGRDQFGNLIDDAEGSIVENLRVFPIADGIRAKGIVRGNTVVGGAPFSTAINASDIVTDNYVADVYRRGAGITATGVVRGNTTLNSGGVGIGVGVGSTVIGNSVIGSFFTGISAGCPSNLTDNTAVNTTTGPDLAIGPNCHNEDNVGPKQ
jgi:hypothetical protein